MDDPNYVMVNGRRKSRRQMWGKGGSEFINGTTMTLHQSYGCNQSIAQGNCYLCDEETLIYLCGIRLCTQPLGRHLIKYDVGKRRQSFIQKMLDEEEVVSMAQSSNGKGVLSIAVAIKNVTLKSPPYLRIYKSNRKVPLTILHHHLAQTAQLMQVQMLQNGKYVLTLARSESMHQISLFKANLEKLLTYNDVSQSVTSLFGHSYQ